MSAISETKNDMNIETNYSLITPYLNTFSRSYLLVAKQSLFCLRTKPDSYWRLHRRASGGKGEGLNNMMRLPKKADSLFPLSPLIPSNAQTCLNTLSG